MPAKAPHVLLSVTFCSQHIRMKLCNMEIFCVFFFCPFSLRFLQPNLIYPESYCNRNANTDDAAMSLGRIISWNEEQGCPLGTSLKVLPRAGIFFIPAK